ncbi:MAG: tripartite tricarboxylate transporter TctB family protein [Deltaproteobacteria bacterium]|nr:tripartite tricarboxylate transporter TctB family protein [Deltaproteobacteria bacterium]
MKTWAQNLFTLLVLLVFGFAVWRAREWPLQAQLFPWAIGIPMFLLGVINLVLEGRLNETKHSSRAAPVDMEFAHEIDVALVRERTFNILAWILGFFLSIWLLGFQTGIPLLMFLYLKIQSRESLITSALLAGAAWLVLWGIFGQLLALPLTKGVIGSFWAAAQELIRR